MAEPRPRHVVDVHAHVLPMPLLRGLADRGLADLSGVADEWVSLDPRVCGLADGARIPLPAQQYDLAARLADMDRAGVSHQVVSAPPFVFASESRDDRLTAAVVSASNDAVAELVAGSGGRLTGLATVPVGLPGAVDELRRCLDELGLHGATIGTFGGGRELDDPVNEPLWAELARRRTFVLVHPSTVSAVDRLGSYHLVQLLGYPAETALATARLVLGGVLDRHDLVLCLAHGGGCLPGVGPRLDLGWHRKDVTRVSQVPPTRYLRRLYYDTAVFDPVQLRRLVDDMGADRVLLGTDTPFDLADRDPVTTVTGIGLDAAGTAAVLGENALRLLGLRLPAPVPATNEGEPW
ncbi:amidohydrolase [Pseudonocardia sulfidoxydans NBRC 16205]|uniref:Amidohydrolase n=1 Tax=Pseudonocardia sulfidoxydans NBRC 16205 TaxID=1223511 RepID=A0A511DKH7_9PSEU|nr:amidohydrolase family protein [Pseudonocardia sulfidoxydans]GEL25292.1 amidohydrolase [Pseudonocardia sulfidoxydans NBRC 16205]